MRHLALECYCRNTDGHENLSYGQIHTIKLETWLSIQSEYKQNHDKNNASTFYRGKYCSIALTRHF